MASENCLKSNTNETFDSSKSYIKIESSYEFSPLKSDKQTEESKVNLDRPISDTEKKIRRAERFGMPVKLSEQEKRSSRAERFGTDSTLQGLDTLKKLNVQKTDTLKKSDEQKRKDRAERFGIPVPVTPADEDSKKKARLARFGTLAKSDSNEVDKRKARENRFAVPNPTSFPQINLEGNIVPKHVSLGKASGGV